MTAIVRGYNRESVQAAYLLYMQAMTEFTSAVRCQNGPLAYFWGDVAINCQIELDKMMYRNYFGRPIQHLSFFEFVA